jgi:hypothetical protein
MTRTCHAGELFDLQAHHDAFATIAEAAILPDAQRLYEQARRGLAVTALRKAYRSCHRSAVNDAVALELMAFSEAMFPGAERLIQWRSVQWRRTLLRRWPSWPRPALESLSYMEHGAHSLWLLWTGM